MRNNLIFIAGLLILMLMISEAGAEISTITLDNTNEPALNGIQVQVTYDDVTEKLSAQYVDNSAPVANTPLGIDKVYFNLDGVESADLKYWKLFTYNAGGGFGAFDLNKKFPGGQGGIFSPLDITTIPFTLPIHKNLNGATTTVHIRFSDDCSAWVSDATVIGESEGEATGCGSPPNNDIPEFPTVALPIAAIIGLVFFFQQRKARR